SLQSSDDPTVSLYVDKTVPMEQVVQVMNIAKRNQYKIILATSPE
ncbi:MAG TPA: biopolymer transporter ExbD, partial [Rikenellaceae bacterium]|nr:biopolymer transporter ExbD [Rikenellaceae bacterium]